MTHNRSPDEPFLAVKGIWASPWTGLQNLRIFFNSASFELIIFNTLSISLYELIAGFPMPVLLALIFHYTPLRGVKRPCRWSPRRTSSPWSCWSG